ncbi:uncharacterized protein [Primulina huaijiensis]|uniref:uncharacterized protein n=1 Tax=Primulina huaijiensis TaxID=1492673 RepID=UPI003CC709C7
MSSPEASGRMVKWAVELSEFGLEFKHHPAIKAQVLTDFLVEMTTDEAECSVPTWVVHVDGSSTSHGSGAEVRVESPQGDKLMYSIKFQFLASNNEAEYEALVAGIKLALSAGARSLVVHSDSQLVVNQLNGTYEAKEEKMNQYVSRDNELLALLEIYEIKKVPKANNEVADRLAKIASSWTNIDNRTINFLTISKKEAEKAGFNIFCVKEEEPSWKEEIVNYLMRDDLPRDPAAARKLRIRAARFTIIDGEVYKRGYSQLFLKCLIPSKADYVLCEIHEGICGNHLGGKALAAKTLRQVGNRPGGTFPLATRQRKFLIVAVDYFTKWVEAEPLAKISEKDVIGFLWKNILCRFGIPRALISDNDTQFSGAKLKEWCQHLKTRLGNDKGNWMEELSSALWAYRTTTRTSTGESPFNLAYGIEAVARAEIGETSLRVKQYKQLDNDHSLRASLDLIDELREKTSIRVERYRARMAKVYNNRVNPRSFQVEDLVMRKADVLHPVGKLDPKWKGSYKVVEIIKTGIYRLQHQNGKVLPLPWNVANLKKFYA